MLPFRRNVLTTSHRAHTTDFNEFEWLLKYATTELWYEKPSKALLKRMKAAEESGCEPDELAPSTFKVAELETPKVWASAALTIPTDENQKCTADHTPDLTETTFTRPCQQCTDKSAALDAMNLVYYLVFNSLQAHELAGCMPASLSNMRGRQMYKLVKCGSREAAIAEVFHATGLNGWNLVFSCVTKASEDIDGGAGKLRRVEDLWMLADDDGADGESVRVFY